MNSSKASRFSQSELASLSVWHMPDVSGQQEPVNSTSKNSDPVTMSVLTVDEIETMQNQAYEEAFSQGKKEGYSEGYSEGFNEGLTKGSKQGYEENVQLLQNKAAAFTSLLESLSQPFKVLDAEVEKELVKLAIGIATQIIRREIKLDPGQVIAAVRESINVLPLSSQKISLSLHPEDAELVRSALSLDEMSSAWKIVEDPLITHGGCKVDTEFSHIDATVGVLDDSGAVADDKNS